MEFGLGFMLLLLVVGGFAAYQGDRVGMMVGKRRLSIFGLRPRYTSRIITILTGVFIVLITLISLLALSSSVRQAMFGMERLRSSVTALSLDVTNKNSELATLEKQQRDLLTGVAQLKKDNQLLQTENVQMQNQNAKLGGQNTQLKEQNKQLSGERDSLTKRTSALQAEQRRLESDRQILVTQLAELRRAGDYYFDQANRLQQANADLRQASFIYHALDVIAAEPYDTSLSDERLRKELHDLVDLANTRAVNRGVGNQKNGIGVRLDRVIIGDDQKETSISSDTVIDLAVAGIHSDPTVKSVIVELVALTNAAQGEAVLADFILIRNLLLYSRGEVVAKRSFDGRVPRSQLFEAFVLWMQGDIRQTVSEKGLMPQTDGTFGGVSPQLAFDVVDEISGMGEPVEVTAYAAAECWTRGPLTLGFTITKVAR